MTWETEDQLHDLGQVTATLNLSFHAHSKGLIKPGAWCLLLRSHCSCAQLWTAACQASLSMGVSEGKLGVALESLQGRRDLT